MRTSCNWQMNYVPSVHFIALTRFLGGTSLAMLSMPVSRVPTENGRSQDACLKYSFLDKLHSLLDFSLKVLTVFCLGYWVPNLKNHQQACSHGLQNMRNIQQHLDSLCTEEILSFLSLSRQELFPSKKRNG